MYLVRVSVLLSLFVCFSSGLLLYGKKDGLNFLFKELNETVGLFDSSFIQERWLRQPLDHLNRSDIRTWNMRYFQRLDMWKTDGPIYIFINGEGKAGKGFLRTGITYELARDTNGAIFSTEHRYYGKSKPFKNFTTENLKYLSSRQALADVARLLKIVKKRPEFRQSKVVVVGGSYAGNLAAWMKYHYSRLVDAAIASSGPVLAKADFFEYLERVSYDYEQYGTDGCFEKIVEIFEEYQEKFETKEGIMTLKEEEQICEETDMTKPENKQLFFLDKASDFMSNAQYGNLNSIRSHCDEITNGSHLFSSKYDDETLVWDQRNQCYDYEFDHMIESIKGVDWYMAWMYQTCTEFGYYQTTTSNRHPFTDNVPLEFYLKMCSAMFGDDFDGRRVDEGVEYSNMLYGGLDINVTNVVFVNGELDPWNRLSILEDVEYEAPAKMIPFASHCRDLFSDRSGDHEELKEARRYIKYLIKRWIGAGEYSNTGN